MPTSNGVFVVDVADAMQILLGSLEKQAVLLPVPDQPAETLLDEFEETYRIRSVLVRVRDNGVHGVQPGIRER
jgi:hypothetical protein